MEKQFNSSLKKTVAYLHFEDGTTFKGFINRNKNDIDIQKGIWGEAAFTTGMSGYQETITDPSFLGQHIIFTNSHIGNYEPNKNINVAQSSKSFATCIITRHFSHNSFLEKIDVPLFSNVDTRRLVKYLTQKKNTSHKSVLTFSQQVPSKREFDDARLITDDLQLVSQSDVIVHKHGPNPIVIINYGIKNAIIDQLKELDFPLISLPHSAAA